MRRLIFSLSILPVFVIFFGNNEAKSQDSDVLDGIYAKEHVPARKPVPYHHLREADMMWSKRIWRILNLREKINHPLYYPTNEKPIEDRYSLTQLIIWAIENSGMQVYGIDDDEFTTPISLEEVTGYLGSGSDTTQVETAPDVFIDTVIVNPPRPEEVTRYLMKEVWYFDKQRSKLEVRIVGLCPIRRYRKKLEGVDEETGELTSKLVCWVYYPAARSVFANHEVFNQKNDSERRTFEDVFFKRHFASFVYRETNVFNDRRIDEYQFGLDAQLEAEKVKDFIFKLEHDLWEY